jgi:hypothetical protein
MMTATSAPATIPAGPAQLRSISGTPGAARHPGNRIPSSVPDLGYAPASSGGGGSHDNRHDPFPYR